MLAEIIVSGSLAENRHLLLRDELDAFTARQGSVFCKRQISQVRQLAMQYLDSPIPELGYSLFAEYWKSGDRIKYEAKYFERRGRLLVFALMSWIEPKNKTWTDALAETLWAICSEPFWSLPAHYLGTDGQPLPMEDYYTHLDLFACETGFAVAEALAVAGRYLPEEIVKQTDIQVRRRIFEPFLDRTRSFVFEELENNWSAVCAGAIGGAALHMLKCGPLLDALITRCLQALSVYLSSFGEDGICTEGIGYWTYGFGFYTCFADLLQKRSTGKINLFDLSVVRNISMSQQWFYFSGGTSISFSDADEDSSSRAGLSRYLFNKTGAVPPSAIEDLLNDGCYRFCLALRDLIWALDDGADQAAQVTQTDIKEFEYPRKIYVKSTAPNQYGTEVFKWFPQAQWFLSRSGSLAIAAKAGTNSESHNHNDCGSFILYLNGKAVICDLGAGLYTAAYFGSERYDFLVNRSKSHNVPMINGCEQQAGSDFYARGASASQEGAYNRFSVELSHCYADENLLSLSRVIEHDRKSNTIVLTDTAHFASDGNITECFCSREPILIDSGTAVFCRDGESVILQFDNLDNGLFEACVETEYYQDHYGQHIKAYFLRLTSKIKSKEHVCRLVFASR